MLPLFVWLLAFSPLFTKQCSSEQLAPALYVFGDSLTDHGNNNFYSWVARANYPPYGKNFPNGITGRFTDGKTFADITAEFLGLRFPRAYRKPARSTTGYTYASAGCGILPETGTGLSCLSMDGQMVLFNQTITKELVPLFETPAQLSEYLANSIFIVWGGSNDYLLNYFTDPNPVLNPEQFALHLINSLSEKLKTLYELGARKLVVLEVGPLGCLPVYRKSGNHNATWCDTEKNEMAAMFNNLLGPVVQNMASSYPDSYFTLGKLYHLTNDVFQNPANYGMTNVSHSCCVTGELLKNLPCFANLRPCEKPEEYLFWDGAHPTEASHRILATPCFNGSGVCVPNNIEQLVQKKITISTSLHSSV